MTLTEFLLARIVEDEHLDYPVASTHLLRFRKDSEHGGTMNATTTPLATRDALAVGTGVLADALTEDPT